ncbi:MAG: methionine--tRNA ligase [SAR86 cluster bacterium SAR86B]|uniref:Methionine--tRNA ligase n=1 Tax=SAR86 cluster bacterium SAR86B TaxID=1123867 RepID=J4WW61_9GAMM|nr:MAG: methionine--tRNA ligase [SAR86 cluster bacterium SAR86B]
MTTKRKIIVTSALPYANAELHLGHILEAVQTDIWVRLQKSLGNECHYFCADDTHGTPVMLKAEELDTTPEKLINSIQIDHINTYKKYNINFTNFHSTHSDENKFISEDIYNAAKEKGLINKKTIDQLYDETKQMFLSDRFVVGTCPKCGAEDQYGDSCDICGASYSVNELIKPKSSLSGSVPVIKQSDHIFFDLNKQRDVINDFISTSELQKPIINKLSEWLDDDLRDWDISRDAPYFGFKIPDEVDKYFYVWLDAPIGYIASTQNWLKEKSYRDLWSKDSEYEIYHFIGKDIAYFHGLFWPALLESADLKLPSGIFVHGFLTLNGEKMSKSKGTGINAQNLTEVVNSDLVRYYFACKLNDKVEDIDLNLEDLIQRVNSEIIGKYLNIASRCSSFINKNNNKLSNTKDDALIESILSKKNELIDYYTNRQFSKAVKLIMELADSINKYINDNEPWKQDHDKAVVTASSALEAFKILTVYLSPIIPEITNKSFEFLNIDSLEFENIDTSLNDSINNYKPILNRLEKIELPREEDKMTDENQINIDDFIKIDLRVAKVKEASHVDGADKLLKLVLDVGDLGERQVFAGIKKAYDPEDLNGRLVVLVANLKPRQMSFGLSEGMVLASSNDNGIYIISPDEGAEPGQRVK